MYRLFVPVLLIIGFSGIVSAMPASRAQPTGVGRAETRAASALADISYSVTIEGAQQFQTIDGFGVNANGASWDDGRLAPALDLLSNTMGVRIWRVIQEEADWEAINDNDDPNAFNWDYYNAIYESGEFPSLWSIIAYLNQLGDNRVMLNVMGRAPDWMGRTIINVDQEDEWVEMIASLVYYGRKVKNFDFTLLSPANEVDIGAPEGPQMSPEQYARVIRKLIGRLDALDLSDTEIVPPDIANISQAEAYLQPLFADPTVMARVQHMSFHNYGGFSGDVDRLIKESAYPDRNFWMTEFSAWCPGCDSGTGPADQWEFGLTTFDYLISHIEAGAAAALIYEGYDSYYEHHGSFGYWGLLSYDEAERTYTPTKRFYINAHMFRYVQPGMVRVAVSGVSGALRMLAFKDPVTGSVTLAGRNTGGETLAITGVFADLPVSGALEFYQTTPSVDFARGDDVPVTNNTFTVRIDPNAVFTLTNLGAGPVDVTPPTVTLTAPANGATVAGPAVVVTASASDDVGVASVQFLLDGAPLGQPDASAPYEIVWDSTAVADGAHTLGAQARDAAGNVGSAAPVQVTVNNGDSPEPRTLLGHTVIENNLDTNPNGMAEAFQYTAIASGTANQLAIYLDAGNTATQVTVGIYTNGADNNPAELLSQATISNPVAGDWNRVSLPPTGLTANAVYWIAVLAPANSSGAVWFRDVIGGGKSQTSAQQDLSALPDSWHPGATYASAPMSAYAIELTADTAPPSITSTAPAADATAVDLATTVTATFDEPVDPTTVTTATVELRGPDNSLVAATVAYEEPARTAILTPTAWLSTSTTYTATVKGGSGGIKDLAGNSMASSTVWSFTTAATPDCPCSIWSAATTPGATSANDSLPVELGVKFQSSMAGAITAIRFYKSSGATGEHRGNLWSSSGQLLATAVFSNETSGGWQEASFASPVTIAANTTYIASYHTSSGRYAVDNGYFATDGAENPPLRALRDGEAGGNGVFVYGSTGFPFFSYQSTNYWVDVVFTTTPATEPARSSPLFVPLIRR